MSHRTEQLASVLQRAVQTILERGLSDPRVKGAITVTSVKVSPDLKNASISVSIFPEEHEAITMHGLRAATRFLRRQTAELVALHRLPEFEFRIDKQIKKEAGVLSAIHKALADIGPEDADEEEAPANATPADPDASAPTAQLPDQPSTTRDPSEDPT